MKYISCIPSQPYDPAGKPPAPWIVPALWGFDTTQDVSRTGCDATGASPGKKRRRANAVQKLATFGGLALLLLMPTRLSAATRTVQNNNDSGPGSLRAALAAAVNNDIINFAPTVRGTITLSSGPLVFETPGTTVEIEGPGADLLTLSGSGNPAHGVLRVTERRITLRKLTIANGNALTDQDGHGGGVLIRDNGASEAHECVFNPKTEVHAAQKRLRFSA